MAPFFSLVVLFTFALFTVVTASPHIARHVHEHVHIARPRVHIDPALPPRRRSLNRRCAPHSSNSTTLALPSSTAPATVPSVLSSSSSSSSSPPTTPTSPYVQPSSTPTSSSEPSSQAPPPTTSVQLPTTTSSPPPPPPATTPSSAAPAQTSSSSNSGGPSYLYGVQSGQGTWFEVGLGACGITSIDSQNVVAVSHSIFDTYPGYNGQDPNTNPVCNKGITIRYGGTSVNVIVVDRCVGCDELSLDLAPGPFSALAALSVGRIDITWEWSN